jgi:diphosphomevalonate decarboxylase
MRGKARAYTNIALIKYWGKKDDDLILPMNSSLSLTLDAFYTETEVIFDEGLKQDCFYLNEVLQSEKETLKLGAFINHFRKQANCSTHAVVKSQNYVPTAAGLASSASGFAALAGALNQALGLNLDKKELSKIARLGSGSATRSIYGGFVEWKAGNCHDTSYAHPMDDASWDVGMIVVIVNQKQKNISSREGMKRTVATSPFYRGWLDTVEEDLKQAKVAIQRKDFEQLGKITESNALKMHATMLGANPPFCYFEADSIKVMQVVEELRCEGVPCYFTMDAGPNVKILCRNSQAPIIMNRLKQMFKPEQIILSGVGPDLEYH